MRKGINSNPSFTAPKINSKKTTKSTTNTQIPNPTQISSLI